MLDMLFPVSFEDKLKNLIIEHRKKSNLSQNDLAIFAGVSRTAIQRLEQGNLSIQMDNFLKILKVLNIHLQFQGPMGNSVITSFSITTVEISFEETIEGEDENHEGI